MKYGMRWRRAGLHFESVAAGGFDFVRTPHHCHGACFQHGWAQCSCTDCSLLSGECLPCGLVAPLSFGDAITSCVC